MNDTLRLAYSSERFDTATAQWLAHLLALAPMAFQAVQVARRRGLLSALDEAGPDGLTEQQMAQAANLSTYATRVVAEALLVCGVTLREANSGRDRLSKVGWFLRRDEGTGLNFDFSADVCYRACDHLEAALEEGRPAGLAELGPWTTVYQGLSQLPEPAKTSWFAFDHFYSDAAFDQALDILLQEPPLRLLDVGGNTGRFALKVLARTDSTRVTVCDLPQQTALMRQATANAPGAERLEAYDIDVLQPGAELPAGANIVWMSQFLDCFADREIVGILRMARRALAPGGRIAVLETLWDNQAYPTGALDLALTSLYFTAVANGNSKMYGREEFLALAQEAGLRLAAQHGPMGHGHTLMLFVPND